MTAGIDPTGAELARMRLAVMRELQTSLSGSQTALLALDLAGIEQGTREQVDLSHRLGCGIAQERAWLAKGRRRTGEQLARGGADTEIVDTKIIATEIIETEIEEELRQGERRVWEALRLQSALLARARAKLRVLSNILAGPSANYSPPAMPAGGTPRSFDFPRDERI